MHVLRRAVGALFTLSLAALLLGGIAFVAAQALALALGLGQWLDALDDWLLVPACIAASVCAVAGYLLGYSRLGQPSTEASAR